MEGLGALPALQQGVSWPPCTQGASGGPARCEDGKDQREVTFQTGTAGHRAVFNSVTLVPWVAPLPVAREAKGKKIVS